MTGTSKVTITGIPTPTVSSASGATDGIGLLVEGEVLRAEPGRTAQPCRPRCRGPRSSRRTPCRARGDRSHARSSRCSASSPATAPSGEVTSTESSSALLTVTAISRSTGTSLLAAVDVDRRPWPASPAASRRRLRLNSTGSARRQRRGRPIRDRTRSAPGRSAAARLEAATARRAGAWNVRRPRSDMLELPMDHLRAAGASSRSRRIHTFRFAAFPRASISARARRGSTRRSSRTVRAHRAPTPMMNSHHAPTAMA